MRHLTVRGRCFLACGATAVVGGMVVGERDFARLGLLAVLVPLLSLLAVRRERRSVRRLEVHLRLATSHVESGGTARVELEVVNTGGRAPATTVELVLPPGLGGPRRARLPALLREGRTSLHLELPTGPRGHAELGPVRVRTTDPLGMAVARSVLPARADLLVTPRTEALAPVGPTGRPTGAGARAVREVLGGGTPDVSVREYALGDDLRRIHWPTSARVEELMVRREEQEWRPRCTVLLDDRAISYPGASPSSPAARSSSPDSAFERAVVVAASVLRALADQDVDAQLLTTSGSEASGRPGGSSRAGRSGRPSGGSTGSLGHRVEGGSRPVALAHQLERLALVTPSRSSQLRDGTLRELLDRSHGAGARGAVVAVLGRVDEPDHRLLAGVAAAGRSAYAVVLGVDAWAGPAATGAEAPAAPVLRRAGWRAATLARGGSLAAAWAQLAGVGQVAPTGAASSAPGASR